MGLDKGRQGVWTCLAVVVLLSGAGVVAANEGPMAEAGLDQTVEQNATVYLDAGGSQDPDGTVEGFAWTIIAPNGTTFSPDCADCERTDFRATRTGTYEITVTVTDDGGATRSDTMYVDVESSDPPSVRLTGPSTLQVGENGTVTAEVSRGDDALSSLVWIVDGDKVGSREIDGPGSYSREVSFSNSENHSVQAEITDILGRSATASKAIRLNSRERQVGVDVRSRPRGGSGTLSRETEPGVYFNNQGEVVDVQYGGRARAQDAALRLGGATISGSRIERKLDDGEFQWSEIKNTLVLAGVDRNDLFTRATKYKINCNPQGSGPTNCKVGTTVDLEEPRGDIQYADGPSTLTGTGISSLDDTPESERDSQSDQASRSVSNTGQDSDGLATMSDNVETEDTANIFDDSDKETENGLSSSLNRQASSIDLGSKTKNEQETTENSNRDAPGTGDGWKDDISSNTGLTVTR